MNKNEIELLQEAKASLLAKLKQYQQPFDYNCIKESVSKIEESIVMLSKIFNH